MFVRRFIAELAQGHSEFCSSTAFVVDRMEPCLVGSATEPPQGERRPLVRYAGVELPHRLLERYRSPKGIGAGRKLWHPRSRGAERVVAGDMLGEGR